MDHSSIKNGDGEKSKLDLLIKSSASETKRIVLSLRDYRASNLEKWGRARLAFISMAFIFLIYICFAFGSWSYQRPQYIVNIPPNDESLPGPKVPSGYLVWSPSCQIPALEPLAHDVMGLFHIEDFEICSHVKPLTSIKKNLTTNNVYLVMNESLKKEFSMHGQKIDCCYQEIIRNAIGKNADNKFNATACISFHKTTKLQPNVENILVRCKSGGKATYTNAHAFVRERPKIRAKINQFNEVYKKRPLSVLMLSIDSISRLNLIRAMPMTAQHLYDNGWFELQGYNKIDDNTYPNLMAILNGYNSSLAYNKCEPTIAGKLETCPFIWKTFRDAGYVTAYGEDEASISTFNYHKQGFIQQPTDFYMRPYMLAAEKNLHIRYKNSLKFCLGFKHSADHIYDYAIDFADTYKNDPFFGLFWTNTFSHNDISDPSSMDNKMRDYIIELERRSILNNSMVVFFSDHGLRFGPVRHLATGWLEERLPFIFIWLPEWFRKKHSNIVQALKINRNRLTNPYDLHMTLKHLLELSERVDNKLLPTALSCPQCQSLFKEMPWNRSCEDCSIAGHWCTCSPYKIFDKNSVIVQSAVKFVLNHINGELIINNNSSTRRLCAELRLKRISYVKKAEFHDNNEPYDDYMIVFEALPGGGWFEATVRNYLKLKRFELSASVSRLNVYADQSQCMKIDYLRKYCYCLK